MSEDTNEGNEGNVVQLDPKNMAALEKKIAEAGQQIAETIRTSRAQLNADKASLIEGLVSQGINRDAFDAALKRSLLTEKKQQGYDLSYSMCCKALGVSGQEDLFEGKKQEG